MLGEVAIGVVEREQDRARRDRPGRRPRGPGSGRAPTNENRRPSDSTCSAKAAGRRADEPRMVLGVRLGDAVVGEHRQDVGAVPVDGLEGADDPAEHGRRGDGRRGRAGAAHQAFARAGSASVRRTGRRRRRSLPPIAVRVRQASSANGSGSRHDPTASIFGPRTERHQPRGESSPRRIGDDRRLEVVPEVDPLDPAVALGPRPRAGAGRGRRGRRS